MTNISSLVLRISWTFDPPRFKI